jgi:hypothetical protein
MESDDVAAGFFGNCGPGLESEGNKDDSAKCLKLDDLKK